MDEPLVVCRDLEFFRGETRVLDRLNFTVPKGGIAGLLGKNGAGKSTTINLLMGFLQPQAGELSVLGYPSHAIPNEARARIGLLHEGFTQYDFMTIAEVERFYSGFYPRWDAAVFWDLVGRMKLPKTRRVARLSCGQRSQVTLGVILAQHAELLVLDDFSLGLDVGYRRLFLEYLREYADEHGTTVLLTSHVVSELDSFLDRVLLLQRGRMIADKSRDEFKADYHCYVSERTEAARAMKAGEKGIINIEDTRDARFFYTDLGAEAFARALGSSEFREEPMTFEDVFVGLTGRY